MSQVYGDWLLDGRYWRNLRTGETLPAIRGGMGDPIIDQNIWCEVDDDGDEAGSTFAQEESIDGGWTHDTGLVGRVRFEMVETAGEDANGRTYALHFNHELAGFTAVTGSTALQFASSIETSWTITDGDATTDRITGDAGAFIVGSYSEDAVASSSNVGGTEHNEVEFAYVIDFAQVAQDDEIALRVIMSGAQGTPTYGATPTITVNAVAPPLDPQEFPWGQHHPDQQPRKRTPNLAGFHPGGGGKIVVESEREWRESPKWAAYRREQRQLRRAA